MFPNSLGEHPYVRFNFVLYLSIFGIAKISADAYHKHLHINKQGYISQ